MDSTEKEDRFQGGEGVQAKKASLGEVEGSNKKVEERRQATDFKEAACCLSAVAQEAAR